MFNTKVGCSQPFSSWKKPNDKSFNFIVMKLIRSRFLSNYYIYSCFSNADFTRGIHLIYVLNLGFPNIYTGILQSLLFISTVIFEIPSGFFADKTKKKYSLLFSSLCFILSGILYLSSRSLAALLIIYSLQGLAFAFQSGAQQSILYDKVNESDKYKKGYDYYLSRVTSLSQFSLVTSMIIGGYLYKIGWEYVFIAFLSVHILSVISLLFIKEKNICFDDDIKKRNIFYYLPKIIKNRKTPILFILGIGLLDSIHTPFFIFYQSYLNRNQVSTEFIAIIMASGMIISAISVYFASAIKNIPLDIKIYLTLILIFLMVGIHLFDISLSLSVTLFFLINSIPNVTFIFTDEYVLDHSPEKYRATMSSFASLVSSLFISILYLFLGYAYDSFPPNYAISISALIAIPALILILLHYRFFKYENKIKK